MAPMATRRRRSDVGAARARELVAMIGREFGGTRTNASLSQEEVSRASGLSRSRYGRIERGQSPEVSVAAICRIAAVLGLDASLRFFPTGDPVRDAAQLALLERLRSACHPSFGWRTEVALPRQGDPRAWDAVIDLPGPPVRARIRVGVEAETRPNDAQALERKLALKERDGGVDRVILLLADTRNNRTFLRSAGPGLRARFPIDGRRALALLAAGSDPGGNAIILL